MISFIVCFLSVLAVAPPTIDDPKGLNRQDCGFPGITADQCAVKGCCYEAVGQAPYCFYADEEAGTTVNAVNPVKDACCTYADLFRVSCGEGLTQLECTNKGCCFSDISEIKCAYGLIPVANAAIVAPLVVNNQIQQGIVIGEGNVEIEGVQDAQVGQCPVVAAGARKDCGFVGITKDECTQKNCCWGLLEVGQEGPVCYENNIAPKAVGYQKTPV